MEGRDQRAREAISIIVTSVENRLAIHREIARGMRRLLHHPAERENRLKHHLLAAYCTIKELRRLDTEMSTSNLRHRILSMLQLSWKVSDNLLGPPLQISRGGDRGTAGPSCGETIHWTTHGQTHQVSVITRKRDDGRDAPGHTRDHPVLQQREEDSRTDELFSAGSEPIPYREMQTPLYGRRGVGASRMDLS